ncbi:class I SAM-dependent methyltransferase [uncultured Neptuniibacter sp.]|uniref:class I SAM-dependent methyltransferase n=1 Tax=uncultured Neptuniibacter sp. TaxID=502143 RepID=UPI002601C838|nr:class I SAM-dependent methyltransferase [uncultured Neptuniibacter sp.]
MQTVITEVAKQLPLSQGESRRIFHGRGHCFSGFEHLVIDWFPPVAVARLYKEVEPDWIDHLSDALKQFEIIKGLVIQQRSRGRDAKQDLAWGEVPEQMNTMELGLFYQVKPQRNQNSGLFLDMREGRRWVMHNAGGKRVLNLFSYTCAFSVAALAGGAERVVNVDMSRGAINTGKENHSLNGLSGERVKFLAYDLFRSWKRVRQYGPYDLIVIDPPSFQPGSFVAEKDYRKVIRRLNELAEKGAQVLACHNDPKNGTEFLKQLMLEECPDFQFIERLQNPDDFPESELEKGLKVLLYTRER